jgi:single-strand DNA-binding protein
MSTLSNNVRLIGHLGEEPKVKKLESGKRVASFSIATNEVYRDIKGTKRSEATWHRLIAWDKQADVVEKYLKKGSEIAIDGKITNRSYEDKNGEKHYITEIVVNSLLMLDKKSGN